MEALLSAGRDAAQAGVMPTRPPTPCASPSCPRLTHARLCAEHTSTRRYDRERGSSAERGYGARWRKLRKMFLAEHPMCAVDGCGKAAGEVDHITPRRLGGGDEDANLQALCKHHHAEKTAREDGRWGRRAYATSKVPTTIVCGPPGSGKTAYVRERAKWGDLVVDLDAIFHAIAGLAWYEKPEGLLPFACEARDALVARLARASDIRHAWIITSGARATERERLAAGLGAGVVVLEVSPDECHRRVMGDDRRSGRAHLWRPLIDNWWKHYARREEDRIVTG